MYDMEAAREQLWRDEPSILVMCYLRAECDQK